MNRHNSILIRLVLAVAIVTSGGVAPAVADSDDDGFQIFGDDESDEDESTVEKYRAYADGVVNRVKFGLSLGSDDAASPTDTLSTEVEWVNSHSQELVAWYNSHYSAPASNKTYRVELTDGDDTAVRYLEIDSNGTNVTAIRAVESTNRQVDATLTLSGQWVDSLVDETEAFYDTYVVEDRAVESDDPFVNRLKAQYATDTDGIRQILG